MEDHQETIIQKNIRINATPTSVWQALTQPGQMQQWMAEVPIEILTNWTVGQPVLISGELHETRFENSGVVMEFEPERRLAYSHLSSLSGLADAPENYSVIAFDLLPGGNITDVHLAIRQFPTTAIYKHLDFYWNGALGLLKKFVEQSQEALI